MPSSNSGSLESLSPLDGRYRGRLDGLRGHFSESALMRCRLEAEVRWLIHLAARPEIKELAPFSTEARGYLLGLAADFGQEQAARVKEIESQTRHDVKAIELYIKERLAHTDAPAELAKAASFTHIGCTSEDINNVAYALMVKGALAGQIDPAVRKVISRLRQMARDYAGCPMPSRTHGQLASPSTWGKEMAVYAQRIDKSLDLLAAVGIEAKFNGAVGNYNAHMLAWPEADWPAICRSFIEEMGLSFNPCTTQIEPGDWLVRWLGEIALLNAIAMDLCRDMWSYISIDYLKAKPPGAKEVGSSTMPHKVNPIDFENAEGNLSIAIGLAQTLARQVPLSRWQRDLSGSTRLRNIGVVAGHSLLAYQSIVEGVDRVEVNADAMLADLGESYELLAEALQTELRRLGVSDAYEQIKAHSHGRRIDADAWREMISKFDLPEASRQKLLDLTPANYTGIAARLASEAD